MSRRDLRAAAATVVVTAALLLGLPAPARADEGALPADGQPDPVVVVGDCPSPSPLPVSEAPADQMAAEDVAPEGDAHDSGEELPDALPGAEVPDDEAPQVDDAVVPVLGEAEEAAAEPVSEPEETPVDEAEDAGDPCGLDPAQEATDADVLAGSAELHEQKAPLIADGSYLIRTGVGSNLVLDTTGSKVERKAQVVEAAYAGGTKQAWDIAYDVARGLYQISRKAADGVRYVLDVAGGSVANGSAVQLWGDNGTLAQWWDVVADGSGYRLVSALRDGFALDVKGAKATSGTSMQMWGANGSTAQRFTLFTTTPEVAGEAAVLPDGAYQIVSTLSGGTDKVADVAAGSLDNGANVRMHSGNGSMAQRFHLTYVAEGGYYDVLGVASGSALDAKAAGLLPGTNVQQHNANGTVAQQWVIRANANGSYTLVNRANGLALDIAGGSKANDANLQLHTPNGSAAQQFVLRAVDHLPEGIVTLKSVAAKGQVIDITGGSATAGAAAQIHASNNTLAQRFELVGLGGDRFRIRTAASGGWLCAGSKGATVTQQGSGSTAASSADTWRASWVGGHLVLVNEQSGEALTLKGSSTSDGTKLVTAKPTGAAAQRFVAASSSLLATGCYNLKNLVGTYLDVSGASKTAGANVQTGNHGSSSYGQYFYLEASGGAYRLRNAHSGLYLTATGSGENANVVQQASSTSAAQQWKLAIGDGGGIVLLSALADGRALDVSGGSTAAGANVQVHTVNGTKAQTWKPVAATYHAPNNYLATAVRRANASHSATSYLIVVDRANTRVLVMRGGNGNWSVSRNMLCSVGKKSTPTVTGSFTVGSRGYSFGHGYTCYYWTQIYGDYLFHSVLYHEGTRRLQDNRLGAHVSKGCVRLEISNAKWIHDNIPSGTRVIIY